LITADGGGTMPATPAYYIDESIHNRLVEPRKVNKTKSRSYQHGERGG